MTNDIARKRDSPHHFLSATPIWPHSPGTLRRHIHISLIKNHTRYWRNMGNIFRSLFVDVPETRIHDTVSKTHIVAELRLGESLLNHD